MSKIRVTKIEDMTRLLSRKVILPKTKPDLAFMFTPWKNTTNTMYFWLDEQVIATVMGDYISLNNFKIIVPSKTSIGHWLAVYSEDSFGTTFFSYSYEDYAAIRNFLNGIITKDNIDPSTFKIPIEFKLSNPECPKSKKDLYAKALKNYFGKKVSVLKYALKNTELHYYNKDIVQEHLFKTKTIDDFNTPCEVHLTIKEVNGKLFTVPIGVISSTCSEWIEL